MPPTGPATPPRVSSPSSPAPPDPARRCERLEAEVRDLRALAARLLERHEDERRRLARALHDGAGGAITAIRMAAHAARSEDDPTQRRADLDDILAQAGDALDGIRAVCAHLRPPPLDAVGLEAALRWHVERLDPDDRDRVSLRVDALPRRPVPDVEQACFRIAEEALDNALRHSGAEDILLSLHAADGELRLEVLDHGTGFDPDAVAATGLAAMHARADGLGGRVRVSTAPGEGVRVLAGFPFR